MLFQPCVNSLGILLQHGCLQFRSIKLLFDEFALFLTLLNWNVESKLGLYVQHQYMTSPIPMFSWLNERKIPQTHSKTMWKEEISTLEYIVLGWPITNSSMCMVKCSQTSGHIMYLHCTLVQHLQFFTFNKDIQR